MVSHKPFRVIIAGGSVTGLSLANMLQKNGIDFVLLEAYPEIAPQVGASIGLLPHGNRILDQIGAFKEILKLAPPVDHYNFRNSKGVLLAEHKNVAASFQERHGYPILFLDRQMVLQVLYDQIKDKSKILTQKRVVKVDVHDKGVKAITQDGSVYTGDIIVGADGIHSTVREEMWRIANTLTPGYIPSSERTAMPCIYSCIFGISNPCPGIETGSFHSVFRDHDSYLVLGGLNSRCYWFYFYNLGEKVYDPNIPRYTKADEAAVAQKHSQDKILPNLTFGEMYARKISSTMTALPEYVYRKWHYHRIITIGDSVHKFEPISGHGGNAAIETSATMVNELVKALRQQPTDSLTTSQIDSVFSQVQTLREERVRKLVKDAHLQQRLEALESPWNKITALFLLPIAETDEVMFGVSKNLPLSYKLDTVDLPPRPKFVPFQDELARPPKPRGISGWLQAATYIACSALCYYGMWIQPAKYGLYDHFDTVVKTGIFHENPSFPLKTTYTGIGAIDEILTFLDAAFMSGVARWHKGFWMLQIYFLGFLLQPIAIWGVESFRKRNNMALISFVSIWSFIYQTNGIGVVMPLFYVAYTVISAGEPYWWPLSRDVPPRYSKTILPAVLLGYALPTVLMFWPWKDPNMVQGMTAFWQPSPIYVQILIVIFAYFYNLRYPEPKHNDRKAKDEPRDLKDLKLIYIVTFLIGVFLHFGVVYTLLTSTDPQLSFRTTFVPDIEIRQKSLGEGLRNLWLSDFYGFFLASFLWCSYAVWDLKRVGRANVDVWKASALIALANILFGPGSAMSAVWYWRESAMARTSVPKEEAS